jgi:hypothetical protein
MDAHQIWIEDTSPDFLLSRVNDQQLIPLVIVSPPHAGIRFRTRDLYYCKSPGENVVFVRMTLQAIVLRAAYYNTKARFPL